MGRDGAAPGRREDGAIHVSALIAVGTGRRRAGWRQPGVSRARIVVAGRKSAAWLEGAAAVGPRLRPSLPRPRVRRGPGGAGAGGRLHGNLIVELLERLRFGTHHRFWG